MSNIEFTRLHIGGEWVDALDGAEFETVNPATGEVITKVSEAKPPTSTGRSRPPARRSRTAPGRG